MEGLDDILGGGLTPHRLYLVEGIPGAGKTTLALQFLIEGVRRGEPVLYVTLSETAEELQTVAASHGWSLKGVEIQELVPSEALLDGEQQNTMFYPSEVEMNEMTKTILSKVERIKPTRVVVDSLSELRLLADNTLRYRRQILALKQYFAGRQCTIVFLDDLTEPNYDLQIQSIAHGVISLEHLNPEYGAERRRVRVIKYRGANSAAAITITPFGVVDSMFSRPGCSRASAGRQAQQNQQWNRRIGRAAGRWHRARHQCLDCRAAWHRQIVAGRAVRRHGSRSRPARCHVYLRREYQYARHTGDESRN